MARNWRELAGPPRCAWPGICENWHAYPRNLIPDVARPEKYAYPRNPISGESVVGVYCLWLRCLWLRCGYFLSADHTALRSHRTTRPTPHYTPIPGQAQRGRPANSRQFLAKHSAGGPLTPANPADGYWRRVKKAPGNGHLTSAHMESPRDLHPQSKEAQAELGV